MRPPDLPEDVTDVDFTDVDVTDVVARARRLGPLPYSALRFGRVAAPDGGAEGLGTTVAALLDRWWGELGRPDPFVVVEEGAGDGSLAAAVIGASPACAPALRYVLVEPDRSARRGQSGRVHLEPPVLALGPVRPAGDGDEEAEAVPGRGPLLTSLAEPPAMLADVVLAVAWLSSLPTDIWARRQDGWVEVRLAAAADGGLSEFLVPTSGALEVPGGLDAKGIADGWRVPIQTAAVRWVADARRRVGPGRVAVIDRVVRTTAELAVAPGAGRPAVALALDQLDRRGGGPTGHSLAASPLILLQWDVGSEYG